MRVIVTRPEPSASRTARKLRALGHEPLVLPLFRAIHDPEAVCSAVTPMPHALVMTSAEAARAIAEAVQRYNELLSLPLYAVGAATAEAARKLGFRDIHVSKADGIALAVDIAARRNADEGPLLYLAGEPRSPGLESELSARHIPLSVVVCYRMQPIDHAPADLDRVWRSGDETAVLLYSRQAAMRFARLVQASPPDGTRLLCLSPAISEALPDPLRHLAKAPNAPTEDALLALLDRP